jgi:hypothetical protein
MKNILLKIIEFILNVLAYKDKKETDLEEKPIIDTNIPNEEEKAPEVVEIKPNEVIEQSKEETTTKEPKEVYQMLSLKERQTYLKKIGLYTSKIDGIIGTGSKRAIKQFNIIFLNKKSETYTEDTDKLLRVIYDSYNKSPYMVDSDWKYFKNFKPGEFYCTCRKKYCDGWNGLRNKIPMHLLMADQYVRNYFNAPVSLTSTIRCDKRNKEVGGVKNSKHRLFRANDMGVKGVKAAAVKKFIYTDKNTKLPFINYAYDINKNYEHIDVII